MWKKKKKTEKARKQRREWEVKEVDDENENRMWKKRK